MTGLACNQFNFKHGADREFVSQRQLFLLIIPRGRWEVRFKKVDESFHLRQIRGTTMNTYYLLTYS